MTIRTVSITVPAKRPEKSQPERDKDRSWQDRADEIRELLLFIDQEKLEDAGRFVKSVGSGLKGAWKQIKEIPSKIFDWDVISDKVDKDKQETFKQWGETLGLTAGFIASGGHALGGALKVVSGHQQRDTSRKLDGIMDIATAATLGATVAGMSLARAVLAPLAATFNIFRGSYNAAHGFKTHDGRKQLQGALDAVRSAGSAGRLLKNHGSFFKVAGIGLAPIAGAIQAGRGLHDVAIGLRNDNNKKELNGLVDVAAAVGTALAFASGVGVVPAIALAVVANLTKAAYQVSPKVRSKLDPQIDKLEPKLAKIVDTTEVLTKPVRKAWQSILGKIVKTTEERGPSRYTRAQLAEISHLLASDGDYTRQEERRLKTRLERVGQADQLPRHNEALKPRDRRVLKAQLGTQKERVDFLKFLVVAATFDNQELKAEKDYVNSLATVLNVPPETVEKFREEFHPRLLKED